MASRPLSIWKGRQRPDCDPVRCGRRFSSIDKARNALVPTLITQPIIENSIKYAVAPREEGGSIAISAHVVRGRLVVELDDDGPGLNGEQKPRDGHGVGLRNTGERLRQMYGSAFSLELTRAQDGGLRVIIGIPYQTQNT